MHRLARALVLLVLIVVTVAVAAWSARRPLLDAARRRLEPLLAAALDMPVRIGNAGLTLRPLRLQVGDVALGEAGAVLRIHDGRLTIRLRESLRRGRPVADLQASHVEVAPLGFAVGRAQERDARPSPLPKFSLRRVRIGNLRVVLPAPDDPIIITASRVNGRVGVGEGGLLETVVRARALKVNRGDRALDLDTLRAKLEVAGEDIVVRTAVLHGPAVDVRLDYDRRLGHHHVHGATNVEALSVIDPVLREIKGQVALDGTITGPVKAATVDAHVRAPQIVAFDQTITAIDARLRWREQDLEVIAGRATHVTGAYVASGHLTLDDALQFAAKADWQHRLGTAPAADDQEVVPPLIATAQVVARGTLTPLRLDAELTGNASRPAGGDGTVHLTARAKVVDGAMQAEATARQAQGNTIEAVLSIDGAGGLDGSARARVAHVPSWQILLGTAVTPQLQGVLTADAQVSGTRDQPRLIGTVRGKDLTLFGASISVIEAALRSDGERLELERLLLRLTRGSITGAGTFALGQHAHNDWHVAVEDVPTQTAAAVIGAATGASLPLWGGRLNLQAAGSGPWTAPGVRAKLQLDHFYLQREAIDRLAVTLESAWPQWAADGRLEHGPDEHLSLVASGTGINSLALALHSSRWDLRRVQSASRLGLSGQIGLSATATGPPGALSGRMHFDADAVEWAGRALGVVALEAEGRTGSWTFQGNIGEQIAANGTFQTRGELPLRATVEWRDADLAPLIRPDPNVRIDSSGTLLLQVPLRAAARIGGTLQVDRLDVAGTEHAAPLLSVANPILIEANAGRFDLRSFRLSGTGTEIAANGWFSSGGECDIGIDARSDLALVEVLSPAIHAARGTVVLNGRARRPARGPLQLSGSAKLERVAFDVGQPWVALNVNGQLTFRDSIVAIESLTGRLGGGTFSVGGLVDVAEGPQLTWTATELAPALMPDVEAELSGQGTVQGGWKEMTVAGEIEVLRALYDRGFAIIDLIPLFQRRLARPGAKEPTQTLVRLDLHIVAPDELFVDNNVAKIEMRSEIHLTGTADDLVIAGPVEVLNGEVKFRGRTFTLENGLIEFRPELGRQAYLNITARTVVPTARATYTIDTHIVGTTDDYRVTFTSDDPALSQTELVSLVTFGRTVAELQAGGGGVSFSDLLALAPGLYKEQAQARAQSLLGIDRVDIEPGYSKSTGLYEPRVTLAKNLTQDLSASLSSTFGIQRRQRVQLEYRVSPRVSLLADWESSSTEQAGAFGGEVKFRYPFRTFPGWAALLPWPGEDVQ